MEDTSYGRVLSIQSHTVHGHVGNKSAVLPLQLLGYNVDPINSVQFSNHTGYANGFKGDILSGAQLDAIVEGLEANGLLSSYTALLTGYIGSVSFLRAIFRVVAKLRQHNPEIKYYCDPVLGDNGKLYVPEELVEVYRAEVLQHVSVLFPNQFELELLASCKVRSIKEVCAAFDLVHRRGVETIVLTSCDVASEGKMALYASTRVKDTGKDVLYRATFNNIPGHFTGTGDLIAALLVAWLGRDDGDLPGAIRKSLGTMMAVLQRTRAASLAGNNPNGELMLVESRRDIIYPPEEVHDIIVERINNAVE